jgi:RecA-family ATPase
MTDVPDRDAADRFLMALDPGTDKFTFQTLDDDQGRKSKALARVLHGTLAEHWSTLLQVNEQGAGVFVAVNETDFKGRSADNIVRVRAAFVDLDGAEFPDPPHVLPHIITETSPGRFHLYWRSEELPKEQFSDVQKRLAQRYGSDPSVNDLPRVMRLPGFFHLKGVPFRSRLVEINVEEPAYSLDLLLTGVPELARKKAQPTATAAAGVDTFWNRVNAAALVERHRWVPALFPSARYHDSVDTYRVTSRDLGRTLQEDLILGANGILDAGRERGLTPIDCVMNFGTECTPQGAALWLCDRLGVDPEQLGYGARRKSTGGYGQDEVSTWADAASASTKQEPPLPYVDLTLDLVPRQWLVPDRIPMLNVTLLSGEGSMGKSLLLMQLSGAVVLAKDWIGTMPEPGPVLYVSAEEDHDEVRRRMEAVAVHHGSSRKEMEERGLRILSFAGRDAILGQADRNGIIHPTPLFERIRRDALQLRPKLIALDAAADVFGGKENDRAQTRQFITLQRGLGIDVAAAVVLVAHPSLTGIATDTGLSGNTAWHNSVRARLYFKHAPGDDTALRVLEVKKSNYGPIGEAIVLRWRDGVYIAEPGKGTLERLAVEAEIDRLFIKLLRRFNEQGRNVSDRKSPTYAPSLFADEPEAKEAKATKRDFAESMARLFAANRLRVVTIGSASRMRSRIVEVGATGTETATVLPFPTSLPTPFQQPSNGVLTHTPHTPPPVGRGREAVGSAPAPPNREEGSDRRRPQTQDGFQVIGAEPPGTVCTQCGSAEGTVYLIRNPFQGVRSEALHEGCARAWFTRA